jgi:hypothetical protein
MAGHDDYGKRVLYVATDGAAEQYGAAVEVDYGVGQPARIDGALTGLIAIEVESRVSKQVRGAVLDLIFHRYPKKLLALLPVHMSNPEVTAAQCRYILGRYCRAEDFRVVVLGGRGDQPRLAEDAAAIAQALTELGWHAPPVQEGRHRRQ